MLLLGMGSMTRARSGSRITSRVIALDEVHLPDSLGSHIHSMLWNHVHYAVEANKWSAVASLTATFVEDYVRKKSNDPRDNTGRRLVGTKLYSKVFNPSSGNIKLGDIDEPSEQEGWMNLANGLAMALSNVARHRIDERSDHKEYAIGVLGLGSLLLTQLDAQHPHGYDHRFSSNPW